MQKYLSFLVPSVCVAAFFILAAWKLSYPGLHYDELLFANGAWGDVDGTFVYRKLGPVPIFSMAYVGAISTWIYWFIFHIFGVSVWSIRLPMIFTGSAGLAVYFYLAKKHLGWRTAWMATSLLALNPTFVWATRQAYTGIEFVIQMAALAALLGEAPSWTLAGVFVLGAYYKVSFAWWALGTLLGAIFAFPRYRRSALISIGAIGAFIGVWRWYTAFSLTHEVAANFSERWLVIKKFATELVEGTAFYNHLFGKSPDIWLPGALLIILLAAGAMAFVFRKNKNPYVSFLAIMLLSSGGMVFLSSRAVAYWHLLPLLPFFALLAGIILSRFPKIGVCLWALYILQLCQVQASLFERARWDPANRYWSMAIYPLISWCEQEQRKCSSLEWGTHNQILAFVGDPTRASEFSRVPALNADTFYVSYSRYPISKSRLDFLNLAEKYGWDASIDHEISAGNSPVFSLYRLKRIETGNKRPPDSGR